MGLATSMTRMRHAALRSVDGLARRVGLSVIRTSFLDQLARAKPSADGPEPSWVQGGPAPMIVDAAWLQELSAEYRAHPLTQLGGCWDSARTRELVLNDFRSDNPYVWQRRLYREVDYLTTILYVRAHDTHHVLDRAEEDGAFGAQVLELEGRLFSRDLLESANEINFLLDHLPNESLHPLRMVDVGAGYGRLAHRLATVLPDADIYCTDGIAMSTAICDAYIRYRHVEDRVTVVPLNRLDSIPTPITLATNVHSFSEMSYEAVAWWLDWLVDAGVEWLFVVPNVPGPALYDGRSFADLLDDRGFELRETRPKYDDPLVDRYALYPAVYYLYRRA
jgi:Methyltransferase small domain